ncbi:MAG: DUF3520 domain-containing protein [Caldithrix sp.]|nr:MAG: DUF3520 domain-containing protein [Caldithrix sp.]
MLQRPKEDNSRLLSTVVKDKTTKLAESSDNFKFASAEAEFGKLPRDSEFKSQVLMEMSWS